MLTEKEYKALKRLKETLTIPKWKYILVYGLSFGILLAIFSAITDVLIDGYSWKQVFQKRIWVNLAMAPIAGILFGSIMRWLNIKQYRKLIEKDAS